MLYFSEDPTIPLLRSLARGSLKQYLLRALRLWVWLRVLYTDLEDALLTLPDPFTFAEWRRVFFSEAHPADEKIPALHDAHCTCARTVQDWLLQLAPDPDLSDWIATLRRHDSLPPSLENGLNQ